MADVWIGSWSCDGGDGGSGGQGGLEGPERLLLTPFWWEGYVAEVNACKQAVKQAQMSAHSLWFGIYLRVINVLLIT